MIEFSGLTIQTFDDAGLGRKELAQIFAYDEQRVKQLQQKGAGVFFATNPQSDPQSRGIDNTARLERLSLDLDVAKEAQTTSTQEKISKKQKLFRDIKTLPIPPNDVIETKNGLQPIWEFSNPKDLNTLEERRIANQLYRRMVAGVCKVLGHPSEADSISRVVRLPGTLHQKSLNDPFQIKCHQINGTKPTIEKFIETYPTTEEVVINHSAPVSLKDSTNVLAGGRHIKMQRLAVSLLSRKYNPADVWSTISAINLTYKDFEGNPNPLDLGDLRQIFEDACSYISKNNSLNSQTVNRKVDWPKPPAKEAYQGLAGRIVRAIEPESESDPIGILLNFLVAFCSVIGNKPYFNVEADRHPMRLFAVLVGQSSKGRKGVSWGYIRKIFEAIDGKWEANIQNGLSSGEGLIWAVRDQIVKIKKDGSEEIIDPGIIDKRLLVFEDEFSATLRVMNREGNNLSAIIRRAWDTGNLQTLTKNSPAKATGAHICIVGHITKIELLRYLSDTETANGFGNRYLWVMVRRSKSLPFGRPNEVNLKPLTEEVKRAVNYAQATEQIEWADETKPLWASIYPELSEGKPGLIGSILGRAEAYVTRLACIYALLDRSDLIKPEHLKAAVALWEYCERSVEYIFGDASGNPLADNIYQHLLNNRQGLTRNQISDYLGRHKTSQEISQALLTLEITDKAKRTTESTSGRSAEIWTASPGEKSEVSEKRSYLEKLNSHISHNSQPFQQKDPIQENFLDEVQKVVEVKHVDFGSD